MSDNEMNEQSGDEQAGDEFIITPLFGDQSFTGQINLLGRTKDTIYQIQINNIDYFFYIGKLPTWTEDDFEDFLKKNLPRTSKIQLKKAVDSESFVFENKWPFYKITDTFENIKTILGNKNAKQTIKFKQNNYFLQQFKGKELDKKIQVSSLFLAYYTEWEKLDIKDLEGVDRLMYKNLQYPFRYEGQDYTSTEIKYQLNFQNTLSLRNFKEIEIPNSIFKYDKVIEVDIEDIKQAPSQLNEHMNYYKICMFDIENVVVKSSDQTFEMWNAVRKQLEYMDPLYRQLANNLQKSKNVQTVDDIYVGKMDLNSKDKHFQQVKNRIEVKQQNVNQEKFNDKCCDQNEIVCVSFIISRFGGEIIEKIAVVRSEYQPSKKYADRVIQTETEKELLQEVIKLLNHKDYNIIMGFNSYDFDERMIMIKCFMYNLIEEYLSGMGMQNELNKQNFRTNGTMKISGARTVANLCQMTSSKRFSFDVMLMNQILNQEAERADSNRLSDLLKMNKLEDKEGVSYQKITDWFLQYQTVMKELKEEGYSVEEIEAMIQEMSDEEEYEDENEGEEQNEEEESESEKSD